MAPRGATLAVVVVLVAAVVAPPTAVRAAISCSAVYNTLMPCLPYVQAGGTVPRACCGGIQSLLAAANNTPDRRTICGCLKNVANGASGGPYITRAAALPSKCNVSLPYKISTSVNCNAIN
uniref:Non-specific lipid-transfer protein n=1 Tax=Oryza meridionalis TaxID=40149 RepID=A0A0E0C9K7_9ORYZ